MACCGHCQEAGELFTDEKALTELREYRRSGAPNTPTRLLIDGLKTLDLSSTTLLDVGGGVGMIQHELMEAGVSEATLVEASPAYLKVAENETRRRGHADRASFRHGDFVDLAPELPEADLVTLDRVICCYPHMTELIQASTAKATRWYGVTYPRTRWFLRWAKPVTDLYCWWKDMEFRIYLHEGVDEAIQSAGFRRFYQTETFLWNVALYERPEAVTA